MHTTDLFKFVFRYFIDDNKERWMGIERQAMDNGQETWMMAGEQGQRMMGVQTTTDVGLHRDTHLYRILSR